jgi:hypothetical protein
VICPHGCAGACRAQPSKAETRERPLAGGTCRPREHPPDLFERCRTRKAQSHNHRASAHSEGAWSRHPRLGATARIERACACREAAVQPGHPDSHRAIRPATASLRRFQPCNRAQAHCLGGVAVFPLRQLSPPALRGARQIGRLSARVVSSQAGVNGVGTALTSLSSP